ncbi:MAG TPA: LON peptidase substrate-binding domain-containing protein, partial [Thermoanaerobaculia bacterium]
MSDLPDGMTLPLFPLPNVVHFPQTDLKLQIYEPHYRRWVHELLERDDEEPLLLGLVLLRPEPQQGENGWPEVFPSGTAARLLEAEQLDDGGAGLLLHGEFRFAVEREVAGQPFRQALVRPLAEPRLNESDAGLVAVRGALVALVRTLAGELGSSFPVDAERTTDL